MRTPREDLPLPTTEAEWFSAIHPDDVEAVKSASRIALEKGRSTIREYRYRSGNSQEFRWIEERIFPSEMSGRCSGFTAVVRDVTERKRAEEKLRGYETTLRLMLDHSPDGILMTDRSGRILEASSQMEAIFGYTREELLGKPVEILIPERYRSGHVERREAFAAAPAMRPMGSRGELYGRRKDGSEFPADIMLNHAQSAEGVLLFCVIRDITAQERAQAALRASEERYRSLVETASEGIWGVDEHGVTTFANRRMGQMLGLSELALIGRSMFEFVDLASIEEGPSRPGSLPPEGPQRRDFRLRRVDGTPVWAICSAHSLFDASGRYNGAIAMLTDITERKLLEESLQAAEGNYRALFENVPVGVYQSTPEGRIRVANPALLRMLGYRSVEEMSEVDLTAAVHANLEQGLSMVAAAGYAQGAQGPLIRAMDEEGGLSNAELQVKRKDGSALTVLASVRAIRGKDGRVARYEGTVADITARKNLEEELRQSHKMEAVGQLAGGVAHDFNNLLTVILGRSGMLAESLPPDSRARHDVEEIRSAGNRAAALTSQLLAFSRRQVLQPKVHCMAGIVADMANLLRRLIGEHIELHTEFAAESGWVLADRGQIEQVLMNLAVNARDAMPGGGELRIRVANAELPAGPDFAAGSYVLLSVVDTGTGIDEATQARVFEPFFTTKEMGIGTGLGLSTVYGIVRQSGGFIRVASELGRGTTFNVCLPRVPGGESEMDAELPGAPAGWETVLVVEDDDSVRKLVSGCLRDLGYDVLEATGAEEALSILRRPANVIHLLLTDVVMPRMRGPELAARAVSLRPSLRTLFMSGYTGGEIEAQGGLADDFVVVQKPFTSDSLGRVLRQVLDAA